MTTIASQCADFIVGLQFEALPDPVVKRIAIEAFGPRLVAPQRALVQ